MEEKIEFKNKNQKAIFLAIAVFMIVMMLTMLFVNKCTRETPENKPIICKEQCEKQNMTYYGIINNEQCACKNKKDRQIITVELEEKE
jgi:Na+/melibiose symporter-like transporter